MTVEVYPDPEKIMIDINALSSALEKIASIGRGETTVEVATFKIRMKVVTGDEDLDAEEYGRGDGGDSSGMRLIERYKQAVLAHSIIGIDTLDLSSQPYVLTGERTEKGAPIKEPRHIFVRRMLATWPRTITNTLFDKYLELLRGVNDNVEKAIHFESDDLDARINTLEKRLADLKKERATMDALKKGAKALLSVPDPRATPQEPPAPPVVQEDETELEEIVPTIQTTVSNVPPHTEGHFDKNPRFKKR